MISAEYTLLHTFIRLLLFPGIFILSACGNGQTASKLLVFGGLTMGTTYTVKINEKNLADPQQALEQETRHILEDINNKMSTYRPDSELSLLNQSPAGEWLTLSNELYEILGISIRLSELTSGYFDITVGPLVNLWGFGPEKTRDKLPPREEITRLLESGGIRKIELREHAAIRKSSENLYIDLSAIAKGYAVDRLADNLESRGINNYLVEIGGEIRARGVNEIGFAWRIGIEQPSRTNRQVQQVIKLQDVAMATSGDYRNFYEIENKTYSHTINPLTGWPVDHQLASVTVLHTSATHADALATGFLAMGKDKAWKIAEEEGLAVFFIERKEDGYIESYTNAMQSFLLTQ